MGKASVAIISDISEACLNDASRLDIIDRTKTHPQTLAAYLDSLKRNRLIAAIEGGVATYRTIENGKDLLAMLKATYKRL